MGNSFDNRAATWDENPRRIKLVEQASQILINNIDFDSIGTAIDYGCGTGLLGFKFIDKVNEMVFCDTSEGMLEQVTLKQQYYGYTNMRTLNADFANKPEPGLQADLILSMLVLHHVWEIEKLIATFAKVLTPNGLFCWIDLDEEDGSFHGFDPEIAHNGFSRSKIEGLIAKHFEIVYYTNELRIQKEVEGNLREYSLFVAVMKLV